MTEGCMSQLSSHRHRYEGQSIPKNVKAPRGAEKTPIVSYRTTWVSSLIPSFPNHQHVPPAARPLSVLHSCDRAASQPESNCQVPGARLTALLHEPFLTRQHMRQIQQILLPCQLGHFVQIPSARARQAGAREVFGGRGAWGAGHVP